MDMVTAAKAPASGFKITQDHLEKPSTAYVFYCGDLLDTEVKDRNPQWRAGGVIKDGFVTLKYRLGYIRQCEIVELRQSMESEHQNFINPTERKHMTRAYTIEDPTIPGGTRRIGYEKRRNQETLEMELVPDNLLRVPYYPSDDVAILTGQNDGVVAMPVTNRQEAEYAQLFLFPSWPIVSIPRRTADLEKLFTERLAAAQNEFERAVALAAIRSCDLFRSKGMQVINQANAEYQQARVKGWPYTYGRVVEAYFEQLGVPRQDNLDRTQAQATDRVEAALARLAELQAQQMEIRAAAPAPAKEPEVVLPPEPTVEPEAEEPPPTDKRQKKNG